MKLKMCETHCKTKVVATSYTDSEEEHQESVDSENDWMPQKKGAVSRVERKRKCTKSKEDESKEEEEEDVESDDSEEYGSDEEEAGKKAKKGGAVAKMARMSVGGDQPDKDGNLELHLFKNDLTKDFRSDEKFGMWRRDGATLFQKYMLLTEDSKVNDIVFKSSSIYSRWVGKRQNDFIHIKVQLAGEKNEGKVRVVNIAEFERYAVEDRPKVDITPKGTDGGENYTVISDDE